MFKVISFPSSRRLNVSQSLQQFPSRGACEDDRTPSPAAARFDNGTESLWGLPDMMSASVEEGGLGKADIVREFGNQLLMQTRGRG